ncbi:MAG: hypothetical protein HY894_05095 [Deltaproteobacteria bacterium]|nr:hypothetical protein [Deltaproteobacteria bacterium]
MSTISVAKRLPGQGTCLIKAHIMPTISVAARVMAALSVIICLAGQAYAADAPAPAEKKPPYTWKAAVKTVINPHEQINDEGEILWGACLICHKSVPDMAAEKSIKDVKLRFDDPSETCVRCHTVKPHPAGEDSPEARMSGFVVPNHMVVPRKQIATNMRFALKENRMIFPLDPKTGKIICSTCHNPHERGLLTGRADFGADATRRLRSATMDICPNCHRK